MEHCDFHVAEMIKAIDEIAEKHRLAWNRL